MLIFLSHKVGQKPLSHTVIQFMRPGMVQVFPFEVNLTGADFPRKTVAMVNGGRPSLKLFANAAEFVDELRRAADCLIGVVDLFERLLRSSGR